MNAQSSIRHVLIWIHIVATVPSGISQSNHCIELSAQHPIDFRQFLEAKQDLTPPYASG